MSTSHLKKAMGRIFSTVISWPPSSKRMKPSIRPLAPCSAISNNWREISSFPSSSNPYLAQAYKDWDLMPGKGTKSHFSITLLIGMTKRCSMDTKELPR